MFRISQNVPYEIILCVSENEGEGERVGCMYTRTCTYKLFCYTVGIATNVVNASGVLAAMQAIATGKWYIMSAPFPYHRYYLVMYGPFFHVNWSLRNKWVTQQICIVAKYRNLAHPCACQQWDADRLKFPLISDYLSREKKHAFTLQWQWLTQLNLPVCAESSLCPDTQQIISSDMHILNAQKGRKVIYFSLLECLSMSGVIGWTSP